MTMLSTGHTQSYAGVKKTTMLESDTLRRPPRVGF